MKREKLLNSLRSAKDYVARGWSVVPVPYKTKAPIIKGWPSLRLNAQDMQIHFSDGPQNVGVLLGDPSGELTDVDLDSDEAIRLGHHFLPPTAAIFGRAGKTSSHWLYKCPGMKNQKFQATKSGMVLEIRSTGTVTIFPGSVHPSGEVIEWEEDGYPAQVEAEALLESVTTLASAALLLRLWPGEGTRNDTSMALAGTLLRGGWDIEEAVRFISIIASEAGDEDRSKVAAYTKQKIEAGEATTGLPRLKELIGEEAGVIVRWLGLKGEKGAEGGKKSQTDRLLDFMSEVELWTSENAEPFGSVIVEGHRENLQIHGREFKEWLSWRFYVETRRGPNETSLREALVTYAAAAKFTGEQHQTFLRVGRHKSSIYLDLGGRDWRMVEIDSSGWRIISDPPVKFRRGGGRELPVPVEGGLVDELEPFVNVSSRRDFLLLIGFLVGCFQPNHPFPILDIAGQQGSAKTTNLRIIRSLIDPCGAEGRGLPRTEDDLVIAANSNWVVSGDNVSYLRPEMADALCRLSSGGGISKRKLYTDDVEVCLEAKRPVVLTGINLLSARQDLLDRVILITLQKIDPARRSNERQFWAEFEKVRGRILGALFSGVSMALSRLETLKFDTLPRLADFGLWVEAAGPAFGWEEGEFLGAFNEMRFSMMREAADDDPLSSAVTDWLREEKTKFEGSATDLKTELENYLNTKDRGEIIEAKRWPKTAARMGRQLREIAAGLETMGIKYSDGYGSKGTSQYTLEFNRPLRGPIGQGKGRNRRFFDEDDAE